MYNISKGNFNIIRSMLNKNKICPYISYSISKLQPNTYKFNTINEYIEYICNEKTWYIKQILLTIHYDIISIVLNHLIKLIN